MGGGEKGAESRVVRRKWVRSLSGVRLAGRGRGGGLRIKKGSGGDDWDRVLGGAKWFRLGEREEGGMCLPEGGFKARGEHKRGLVL